MINIYIYQMEMTTEELRNYLVENFPFKYRRIHFLNLVKTFFIIATPSQRS